MSAATATAAEAGCPFCKMVMECVTTGEGIEQIGVSGVYHFEPLNPVTPGHRLFIPAFHYEDAAEAPAATGTVFEWAAYWAAERGEEFNLIVNAGTAASQSVRHLHIHYVPRRSGDGLILPWSSLAQKRAEWEAEQRGRREFTAAYTTRSGVVCPFGFPTVVQADAQAVVDEFSREDPDGPNYFVATRILPPWLPVTNTESEGK